MLRSLTALAAVVAISPLASAACPNSCPASQANHHQPVHHQASHHVSASPAGTPDIVDTAVSAGSFNTLVAAVQAAGLVDALKGEGPLTVFAPTDEAFAKIPAETLQSLLEPGNRDKLTAILTYHVVPGRVTADQVVNLRSAKTLQGQEVAIGVSGDKVFVDGSRVTKTDIITSNGVIHVIDTVLMPSM